MQVLVFATSLKPCIWYLFKLSAIVDNIATGDSILIDTYAPNDPGNGNFTDVKDGFVAYDDEARVVIRTFKAN